MVTYRRLYAALIPQYYWNAIYKDLKGKKEVKGMPGAYSFPCDTKLNVSMTFK